MKKFLPIIFVVILLVAGFFFFKLKISKTGESGGEETPIQTEVPISERPYVTLTPRTDGHELKLIVSGLKGATSVEYELVYLANDMQRGVIGSVDLKGTDSLSRDLLLGTCSKNVCKYDEGISEGTVTLKIKGTKPQKYELSFDLKTSKEVKNELSLKNQEFLFQGNLPSSFYLVMETAGLPKMPQGKVVGGPYGIFTAGSSSVKGTISLKLSETSSSLKVFGWNQSSKSWQEYSKGFETDGQTVSVEVDRLTTFVAVSL